MSNMTPFEIRLELLKMARDMLNDDYYGSDIEEIQINTNDAVRIVVTKTDNTQEAKLLFKNDLI